MTIDLTQIIFSAVIIPFILAIIGVVAAAISARDVPLVKAKVAAEKRE